jgi:RNA polymerase sigma-70 factor (ECF subfamily)
MTLGEQMVQELPGLRRFARYLARDPDHANDLVQETLMRALRAQESVDPAGNLRAWLFTILQNVLRSERRRQQRSPIRPDSLDTVPERPQTGGQFETAALAQLAMAIRALPERLREVLVLCGVEGFDYQEAADILKVPIGTVRSRLSRARTALKDSGFD